MCEVEMPRGGKESGREGEGIIGREKGKREIAS